MKIADGTNPVPLHFADTEMVALVQVFDDICMFLNGTPAATACDEDHLDAHATLHCVAQSVAEILDIPFIMLEVELTTDEEIMDWNWDDVAAFLHHA